MVITTTDGYSNRDYKEGDYPTFNDIEYQAETETYLEKNPLARVALKSIMQNTKGDISKVLQNVDDNDASRDLYYKLKGVPIPNKGYIFPGEPEKFKQYSEEEKNNSAIVRVKLSSLDPEKQKTLTGHELGHYGLRVLLDEGRLDKKLFDKLQLADKKIPDITKEEALMHKLSSRDNFNAGTTTTGFVSNEDSNTLDSIAEDYLSGIANEDLGYAKGGDTMPMEQQMQMFAIGGLDDDGMSRDPISGNEIPPGSMANEVRDDVDAKLSDGEYVVPANVVRFFGVKFFEDLRTQAMQGLSNMEANGRIGGEPVPSDMPMQDQMAEVMPDVSDGEMEMLQGLMNEGGYVRGYAPGGAVVPKDVDLENPTPFNPSPFATVGSSFFSPYNTNITPDPNAPAPTPVDPGPNPESGISFVTMVNPATGAIQVVQFMGGDPVDGAAYNKLISSGFFIQGSPDLAQYKQKIEQDNRESDLQAGGDKPKSIEDLLQSTVYGSINLGPSSKILGSVIDNAFPTTSDQNRIDYILANNGKFPPTGEGKRDRSQPKMGNGEYPFQYHTEGPLAGTIKREEAKGGARNAAKEAVAYLKEAMRIRTKHTDTKGKLNQSAYRQNLLKNGLLTQDGLFSKKVVTFKEWGKSAAGIAAIKALGTSTTKSEGTATTSGPKQLSRVDNFELPTEGIGSKVYQEGVETAAEAASDLAEKASKAGFMGEGNDDNNNDNDNRPVGSVSDDAGITGANVTGGKDRETVGDTADAGKDTDLGYREDAGYGLMNKGGIIKKPTKKKKTKKY